jgi:hypothetical protein
MARYIVELSSERPACPQQVTISAASPEDAIAQVLRSHGIKCLLRDYDRKTDPDQSYRGWSFIKVSIDCSPEGVNESVRTDLPACVAD